MRLEQFLSIEESKYSVVFDNGFQLAIVPKPDFQTTCAVLSVGVGGYHHAVKQLDSNMVYEIPAGAAHFLEHKIFEYDETDFSQQFQRIGIDVNAYTTNLQTNYYITMQENVEEGITLLLDMVSKPRFGKQGIDKEKSIIEQELLMYQDDPQAFAFQCLMANMYPISSIGMDILGTVQSINQMTYADLIRTHNTFYRASNMVLTIVGKVDSTKIHEVVARHALCQENNPLQFQIKEPFYPKQMIEQQNVSMDVAHPIGVYGVRLPRNHSKGIEFLKSHLALETLIDLLFGPTSQNFQRWYQQEWVDDSFNVWSTLDSYAHHFIIEASSDCLPELIEEWQTILREWRTQVDLNKQHFDLVIRGRQGDFLQLLNSIESLAFEVSESVVSGYEFFDMQRMLQQLTLEDVINYAKRYLDRAVMSRVIVMPR